MGHRVNFSLQRPVIICLKCGAIDLLFIAVFAAFKAEAIDLALAEDTEFLTEKLFVTITSNFYRFCSN